MIRIEIIKKIVKKTYLYLFDYNTIYIYRERKIMKMKGHQRSGNVSNFGLTTIKKLKKNTNIYHNLMHVQIDEFLVFLFLLRAELIIKSIYIYTILLRLLCYFK